MTSVIHCDGGALSVGAWQTSVKCGMTSLPSGYLLERRWARCGRSTGRQRRASRHGRLWSLELHRSVLKGEVRCPKEGGTVEVISTEDDDRTRADARLNAGGRVLNGWGRARRNPADPDVPAIGEELAAARALSALANELVHEAATAVERFEGHPVDLRI